MGRKNDYLDDEWAASSTLAGAAGGILRITLLFGSAAVALALIIAPLADRGSQAVVDYSTSRSIDEIQTGSIREARTDNHVHLYHSPQRTAVIHPRRSAY